MTDTLVETPGPAPEPAANGADNDWMQLAAALVLGIAAVLTAFSSYKASALGGEALVGYTESTRILSDANAFYAQGNSVSSSDQAIFVEYASAAQAGNTGLADYLTTLMRPELLAAVEWWQATEEAVTPFDDEDDGEYAAENPYTIEDFEEANALEEEAEERFKSAQADDEQGGKFDQSTALMAVTLFFAGVATFFSRKPVAVAMLIGAVVSMIYASTVLLGAMTG